MDDQQRARELLAQEYEGNPSLQSRVRHGHHDDAPYFKAITSALRAAPEGFVMVPVEPTAEMITACEHQWGVGSATDMARREWAAMLAARPQVQP